MPIQTYTDVVIFHVTPAASHLPQGDFPGTIEWATIVLGGHPRTDLMKCTLHLERKDHPEFFAANSGAMTRGIPIVQEVKNKTVADSNDRAQLFQSDAAQRSDLIARR
ncbi:hypothetical protein QA645_41105 [Bradyrhizobium sp. CIAT3101]|uniref:hypothetical protein n=1 Tax=Bradyrhizobium sp. CIAT3101 TaxID=439387 RepID=UPI0024B176AC|nr:hypothetical protein [Bradyrhizobium sp. CIAT3101]WFU80749.1 hypothetical protein QA645_41105 [Bradyrhizobium sp. CIAT3101]